ncbi:MAG: hypothetical protein ACI4RG_02705 [Huintestinicola sp.]
MCRLFEYADRYIKESDWKDIALLKLCLCAIGVLIGISIAPGAQEKGDGGSSRCVRLNICAAYEKIHRDNY